jgi:enolase
MRPSPVLCPPAQVIKRRYGLDATNVGDEGGFAPNIAGDGGEARP